MTTEIGILNKSAVVLAADSAVTIYSGVQNAQKVFNTANKLFSLSKFAPVGIMIFGNASIMGVPWETIIKMYRKQLKNNKFDTLAEYCNDFFAFLNNFNFSQENKNNIFKNAAIEIAWEIRNCIDKWFIDGKRKRSDNEINKKIINEIQQAIKDFSERSKSSKLFPILEDLEKEYIPVLCSTLKTIKSNILPFPDEYDIQYSKMVLHAVIAGPPTSSGIVIAGFGEEEIYPSIYCYNLSLVLRKMNNGVKDSRSHTISDNQKASIVPFAQSDDICSFIEGLAPQLATFFDKVLKEILGNQLKERFLDELETIASLTKKQKQIFSEHIGEICTGAYQEIIKKFREKQRKNYTQPVIDATGFLNKEELATMAETLVNLVSFRKQVTIADETVGGPIDVAVITKGDGMIWIKRKHYFEPTLNQHFFANYNNI